MKDRKRSVRSKWLISDELWSEMQPLLPKLPERDYRTGGRPRVSDRAAMQAIFFVLRTGCQWKALDATGICSGSRAHARFQAWRKAGIFKAFWKKGLQRYDALKGLDWKWQSIDASMVKAPVAGTKKKRQKPYGSRQNWLQALPAHRGARSTAGHRARRGQRARSPAAEGNT
jgi:putative transposase